MISMHEIYNVLLFEFPYFKKINEEKRQLLCKRTKHFIEGTDFIPRKGMDLTNRMLILISACSQQLTLAFPKHYDYAYFEKIIVYPEKYLSTYTEKYHTGEMNTAGIIVFSWDDFYKGIKIDNDAHNVGLHEFAHALEFMDIANKDIDEKFSACLDKFTALADHYLRHQPDKPLFRSYATTNLSEFFAVATEYYFEAPIKFAEQEPELFNILNKAYQQNTAPKISKVKSNIVGIPNRNDAFFSEYSSTGKSLQEGGAYLISSLLFLYIYQSTPILACFVFITAVLLIYKRLFKNNFSLHKNQVQIHKSMMRKFIESFFNKSGSQTEYIDYTNVLYVSADAHYDDNKLDHNFKRTLIGYKYTLCYWDFRKIKYANVTTNQLNCDTILRFLYREKHVGTRLDGDYKKFRT